MTFKPASLTVFTSWYNDFGLLCNGHHIRTEYCHHSSFPALITHTAKTCIQICFFIFCYNRRIKLWLIIWSFSQTFPFFIMNIAKKGIFSSRFVAYCNRNNRYLIKHIIKIIFAIRPLSDIRCIQAHRFILIQGICIFFVNNALISPFRQIIDRC